MEAQVPPRCQGGGRRRRRRAVKKPLTNKLKWRLTDRAGQKEEETVKKEGKKRRRVLRDELSDGPD